MKYLTLSKKVKFRALTIIVLLFASVAYANQGRVVKLAKDGTLIGLPKSYQPAIFDINSKTFQIGKNKFKDFESCITRFLPLKKEYRLEFSASWEHRENSIFPPHITIRVVPKGKKSRFFSHSLSFELDTLKQISSFHLESNSEKGGTIKQVEIEKNVNKT